MFSWVSEKMVGSGLDGLLLGKNIYENMITVITGYFPYDFFNSIVLTLIILFSVLAIGFQCGLSAILYGWVPSSKDQAMFYATSFIWGATSASLEFLILCK